MQYCAYCGNAVQAVSYTPCPRCGNPSNGAPRPSTAPAAKGNNAALVVILVIVGGLFVVAIIGILAAIAIPNLITATQRAKQRRTMADIRTLAVAVEAYSTDKNEYPKSAADLPSALAPKYIQTVPLVDGWGNPLQYVCLKDATTPDSDKCTGYVIGSSGKDGHFEHDSLLETVGGPEKATTNFDCDIVYSGAKFVEYPEGVQH